MTSEVLATVAWAEAEFGAAALGDVRRTRRLVQMAAQAATMPAGKVTAVFTDGADLQAAYDWLENDAIPVAAVAAATFAATARRARGLPYVLVPTDGSSLTLTDRKKTKQTGPIGPRSARARGDKVHTAIGVTPDGEPLGLLGQQWWTRSAHRPRLHRRRRKVTAKETRYWLDVRDQARTVLAAHAPGVSLCPTRP
jgi:hypothetical protein